jgi:hypothetical protein
VAFRARAAAIAREVIEEAGLENEAGLEIRVDEGVPPCDDGGEPLLGAYTPSPEADGDVQRAATSPFVIELFYRTFRGMYDDAPYDVDAEIRETLEHELEHHAGFLAGEDPLDDAEREEIERDRVRTYGPRADARGASGLARGAGLLAVDFARFLRATWPLWIAVIVLGLVVVLSSR